MRICTSLSSHWSVERQVKKIMLDKYYWRQEHQLRLRTRLASGAVVAAVARLTGFQTRFSPTCLNPVIVRQDGR